MIINFDNDAEHSAIRKVLTYKDKQIEMEIRNLKKNPYNRMRFGDVWVEEKLEELKAALNKCILFHDGTNYWTYPGLLSRISENSKPSVNLVTYPEFKLMPWNEKPEHEAYYYQKEAVEKMLINPHCHVEIATGGGKTRIITDLVKQSGLRIVIVAPSSSISEQIYDDCIKYFGKKRVGYFGGSKKQSEKQIVVATAQSLVRIEPESEHYENFQKTEALIFDESHQTPAATFDFVCNNLLAHVPYRWFTSATQERNDGKDLILEGIIGPKVYEKSIQELQSQGYLAKINTMIFDVESDSNYQSSMTLKMNQKHLYQNKKVAQIIADLTYKAVCNDMPTLILVDEHSQEELLRNYLKVPYEYARGSSDVNDICKRFNEGSLKCVIGTSAVCTGTNFLPVRLTIAFQANKAGTKVKQGPIGRSTRIHKASGKTNCKIVDFRIVNVPVLKRHADMRIEYYKEVGPVHYVKN